MRVLINLNDQVIIKELPPGRDLFDKYHSGLSYHPQDYREIYSRNAPPGCLKMQLHQAMAIYGSGIGPGFKTPIERTIEIVGGA